MARTTKLSVSITAEDVRWAKARAKRTRGSVSSVLSEALRQMRQHEARQAFLAKLDPEERAGARDAEEIRRQWLGG